MIACETFLTEFLKCWNGSRHRMPAQGFSWPRLSTGRDTKARAHLAHACQEHIERLIEKCFSKSTRGQFTGELYAAPASLDSYGEEKTVTVLMADLRDFTPLAERLRPEELRRLLNRYISLMIKVIEQYRGTIVDFYGDGILVFFDGKKAEIGERATDAVECAMEMQRELKELAGENNERDLPAMVMGVGIHTGNVSVGFIGTDTRKKFGIVGSAVNETSRIQSLAQAGQVVVSESTRIAIGEAIDLGPRFEAALKGFDGPRALYPVEGIAAA